MARWPAAPGRPGPTTPRPVSGERRRRSPLHDRRAGNITEGLFTSREAIEAAKRGNLFPSGSVITLVNRRSGKLHRYVVMEKREGWGALLPADIRTGDWLFRECASDGTPNLAESGTRRMS